MFGYLCVGLCSIYARNKTFLPIVFIALWLGRGEGEGGEGMSQQLSQCGGRVTMTTLKYNFHRVAVECFVSDLNRRDKYCKW